MPKNAAPANMDPRWFVPPGADLPDTISMPEPKLPREDQQEQWLRDLEIDPESDTLLWIGCTPFFSAYFPDWTEDLEAGVNKLSLPLLASGNGGGQMLVRLTHPDSEQIFVVQLKLDS